MCRLCFKYQKCRYQPDEQNSSSMPLLRGEPAKFSLALITGLLMSWALSTIPAGHYRCGGWDSRNSADPARHKVGLLVRQENIFLQLGKITKYRAPVKKCWTSIISSLAHSSYLQQFFCEAITVPGTEAMAKAIFRSLGAFREAPC